MEELIKVLIIGFSLIGALIFGVILILDLKFSILLDLVHDIKKQIQKNNSKKGDNQNEN